MSRTIIHPNPQEEHGMNTIHPLDTEVLDMYDTKGAMIRVFSRDGVICSDERLVLDRFEAHRHNIGSYRLREIAADALKRNGVTKLVRRYFVDAGLNVVDLETERRTRSANVIQFPTHRDEVG